MGYKFNDSFTDVPPNLVCKLHDCEYGVQDYCFKSNPSIKECLLCHRDEMIRTRDAYLDFYKNVFTPWNNNNEQH